MTMPTDGIKISQLAQLLSPTPNDDLAIVSGGSTQRVKPASLSADYKSLSVMPTVVYNGNRSYTLTFPSVDYTGILSAAMRMLTTATVVPPTRSTSLNGTSQYFNRVAPSAMTFTDDFTTGAWVKMTSYPTSVESAIISRYGTGSGGWYLTISTIGQVTFAGYNGSSANASYVQSYQSIALNKWVYIAAQLDMSAFTATTTTSYIMIDGIDVPALVSRFGTNPTSLTQGGNLEVGSHSGGNKPWPGKIAQAFISSAKITQANVRLLYSQGLTAALIASNNIISAYSFDNSINDLNTTSANNLTAQGSAVATNADSFTGGQANGTIANINHSIIQTVALAGSDTVVNVQAAEGCTIPTSGGVTSVAYSSVKAPYGFPDETERWRLDVLILSTPNVSGAANTWMNIGGIRASIPPGKWNIGYNLTAQVADAGSASTDRYSAVTLSTTAAAIGDPRLTVGFGSGSVKFVRSNVRALLGVSLSTLTSYYLNQMSADVTANLYIIGGGGQGNSSLIIENALL